MLGIRVLHLLRGGERISQYYQGHPLGALPLAGRAMPHTCPCTCRSAPRPRSAIRPVTAPRESSQRRSLGHTQKHKNTGNLRNFHSGGITAPQKRQTPARNSENRAEV